MPDQKSHKDASEEAMAFIRRHGIAELATLVAVYEHYRWAPGAKIDVFIAAELAKLTAEEQVRIVSAFEFVAKRNAEIRRLEKIQKRAQNALMPVIEATSKIVTHLLSEWLKTPHPPRKK